jgi:hypothetical protein
MMSTIRLRMVSPCVFFGMEVKADFIVPPENVKQDARN